jgi:Na+/proline symporter
MSRSSKHRDARYRQPARWIFPLYLLGFIVFVVPIAAAGMLKFGDSAPADAFVLLLPMAFDNQPLAALAFLGGLSAATGMILVSTLALAIMAANELILPLIFRATRSDLRERQDLAWLMVSIRRLCIIGIMALAWLYYQAATSERSLAAIGLVAFAAAAQFAPALFGGLYWRGGNRYGALSGMLVGLISWAAILVLPEMDYVLWSTALSAVVETDPLSIGVLVSLGFNTLTYFAVSSLTSSQLVDRVQAATFVDVSTAAPLSGRKFRADMRVGDLTTLASRFIGNDRVQYILETYVNQHHT